MTQETERSRVLPFLEAINTVPTITVTTILAYFWVSVFVDSGYCRHRRRYRYRRLHHENAKWP